MSTDTYTSFFKTLTTQGHTPHPWQAQLATPDACDNRLIRIPTGLGKTDGVLGAWLYHRVQQQNHAWPMRLVWCLPMRVLAEQTYAEALHLAKTVSAQLTNEQPRVNVHLLMGGAKADAWHLQPHTPAIIIGTQDMLLSRALNRGYAASRARWPMDYGLLNHDCLWVMDEVQLMDVGLATSVQLQSFRQQYVQHSATPATSATPVTRPCFTWWMSATLQPQWLETVDSKSWVEPLANSQTCIPADQRQGALWDIRKPVRVECIPAKDDQQSTQLADAILQAHHNATPQPQAGRVTLAIVNRVDTATDVYAALNKQLSKATDKPTIHLIHSRFRGMERENWVDNFLNKAHCQNPDTHMILIATQVVEAGVDISATTLITELAPWPSLVQRAGRAARYGGSAQVIVIDRDASEDKAALPYALPTLNAAREALSQLDDMGIASLEKFEAELKAHKPEQLKTLYPYEPLHLLTEKESDELFDTTADLTGADLDISRFIRSGQERDIMACWLDLPDDAKSPDKEYRPQRNALCPVPIYKAQKWLFDNNKLKPNCRAWTWNYVDGHWQKLNRSDCYPGQTIVINKAWGGYDTTRGYTGEKPGKHHTGFQTDSHAPDTPLTPDTAATADAAQGRDDQSETPNQWQTIATHGLEVANHLNHLTKRLVLSEDQQALFNLAGRVHDWGKAHLAFQNCIANRLENLEQTHLAKAPSEAWCSFKNMYCMDVETNHYRRGFRHELASTLALFELLHQTHPNHEALLGPYQQLVEMGVLKPMPTHESLQNCPLADELNALDAQQFNLLVYLVCTHHGKVRLSWPHTSHDQKYFLRGDTKTDKPILGVREDDTLPSTQLYSHNGTLCGIPTLSLHLETATIGLSSRYGPSWSDRVHQLKQQHGPFVLAYFECLLRAADIHVSSQPQQSPDPLLDREGAQA